MNIDIKYMCASDRGATTLIRRLAFIIIICNSIFIIIAYKAFASYSIKIWTFTSLHTRNFPELLWIYIVTVLYIDIRCIIELKTFDFLGLI